MTETCANCMWARVAVSDAAVRGPDGTEFSSVRTDNVIRCVRFPQPVVNSATYWCGEYLRKKDAA